MSLEKLKDDMCGVARHILPQFRSTVPTPIQWCHPTSLWVATKPHPVLALHTPPPRGGFVFHAALAFPLPLLSVQHDGHLATT